MASVNIDVRHIFTNDSFTVRGLRKFTVENSSEAEFSIGLRGDESLVIPKETSRTFEINSPDTFNCEDWHIKFDPSSEEAKRHATVIRFVVKDDTKYVDQIQ